MLDSLFRDYWMPGILYRPFPYVVLIITLILGWFIPTLNFVTGSLLSILFIYSLAIIATRWSYKNG